MKIKAFLGKGLHFGRIERGNRLIDQKGNHLCTMDTIERAIVSIVYAIVSTISVIVFTP